MSSATQRKNLLPRLNDEWARVYESTVWSFGNLGTLTGADALDVIRSAGRSRVANEPSEQDTLLHGLLLEARSGVKQCERLLLQYLVPIAAALASRTRFENMATADKVGFAIGIAWETIGSFNLKLTARIHSNLSFAILHALTPHCRSKDALTSNEVTTTNDEVFFEVVSDIHDLAPAQELAHIFSWAINTGTCTNDEIALLARARLGDDSIEDLALEFGVTKGSLYKRIERIQTRLIQAVRASFGARAATSAS